MLEQLGEGISNILTRLFGSRNQRVLKSIQPLIPLVNELEPKFAAFTDAQLKEQTALFKERLENGETLDDILPEAFAAVREASKRTTKMRHFDVQLIGGIVLHRGTIAEMATGEGKTLVATLPAYLNGLTGKGVHIVTVNDYLARRDREWMGPIYEMLGLTVGVIQNQMGSEERKAAYACDITYGTNNEFGFDYLRDNMRTRLEYQVQRKYHYAIVDEVDSILIDEARTPLIISGPAEESTDKYYTAERVASRMQKGRDYEVKEKENTVILTDTGITTAQNLIGVDTFYDGKNMEWPHHIEQALRAKELYKKDKEYIVKDGEVIIVDEFTGRLMPGRRWSDGLHQAVEANEHLKIKEENQTLATITLQNYFKMYEKLSGMTGTAATEAMEFFQIYKLDVVTIPTNKPLIRNTSPDMVFRTEEEKFNAIIEEIVRINQTGRPTLVGTTSIENSERLSEMLKRRGIQHDVLNAKQHEREAQIVAQAGQPAQVTIATNMAGRGTDIILGEGVAALGGLHILGTERHESRRIDNQLRGRAGRQGDPGSSQFVVSMEDTLLRLFAPDWVRGLLGKLGMKDGMALESRMISRAIENAQKKMESHNFDIRKNLLEYDMVMNEQRKIIYGQRQLVIEKKDLKKMIAEMIEDRVYRAIDLYLPENAKNEDMDYKGLSEWAKRKFGMEISAEKLSAGSIKEIEKLLLDKTKEAYDEREKTLTEPIMRELEQYILLEKIDEKWKDHLYAMDQLRSGIGLRSYAQVDPKIEYKREGYQLFDTLIEAVKEETTDLIFKVRIEKPEMEKLEKTWKPTEFKHQEIGAFEEVKRAKGGTNEENKGAMATEKSRPVVVGDKVGRNDPCPCGSGKKYKKCCAQRQSR
ncbi:MAG: preprotein translocase subunit SecA [Planctomycetes bacterium]|nr:preprotein translocase subunit SecA [Planctomycetota bacterium]